MNLSWINLTTTDPSYNLAVEQYVFDRLPRDRAYFMLWQNDNAIIIGKHQNTLREINEAFVREHGIRVVRRLSGGGAVYHDLGNLNFTFIADADNADTLNFHLFCKPVIRTLAQFGVTAEVNGRNDMTIGGAKFSGNAQYVKEGRVMHHGTILFNSDLSVVGQALCVDEEKIRAKGIQSVRSRVTNVSEHLGADVTLDEFRAALLKNVQAESEGEEYVLSAEDRAVCEQWRDERYATWAWNYGESPACTVQKHARIEGCGTIDAYLEVDGGIIRSIAFRGDFFSVIEPEGLAQRFVGQHADAEGYAAAIEGVDVSRYFSGLTKEQFLQLLNG